MGEMSKLKPLGNCLSKRLVPLSIVLLFFFLLTGCAKPALVQKIDQAEQKWNSKSINSYRIQFRRGLLALTELLCLGREGSGFFRHLHPAWE
jgi:hypothetical protein